MPTVLTPHGWVKVAPAPRKKPIKVVDPAKALKGPLAYFSCQPLPPTKKDETVKLDFPYDLSASPEKLKRHCQTQGQAKIGGKNRTISAPQPELRLDTDSDSEADMDTKSQSAASSISGASPSRKSTRSQRSTKPRAMDRSHSPSPSRRSYTRHRPVEAAPRPVNSYYPPSAPYSSGLSYNGYGQQGMFERPPPPQNARSMSYSWYNATTPLNL